MALRKVSKEILFHGVQWCDPTIYIYPSFLSRASSRQFTSFLKRSNVWICSHTRTRTLIRGRAALATIFFSHNKEEDTWRGWIRTISPQWLRHSTPGHALLRALTRVPRCRILTLSVNLFSTRQINEGVLVRLRGRKYCCFCLEKSLIGSGITRE